MSLMSYSPITPLILDRLAPGGPAGKRERRQDRKDPMTHQTVRLGFTSVRTSLTAASNSGGSQGHRSPPVLVSLLDMLPLEVSDGLQVVSISHPLETESNKSHDLQQQGAPNVGEASVVVHRTDHAGAVLGGASGPISAFPPPAPPVAGRTFRMTPWVMHTRLSSSPR